MRRLIGAMLAMELAACGAGVPVDVRVDNLELTVSLDSATEALTEALRMQGLLPPGGLPETWPEAAPDVCVSVPLDTSDLGAALPVDLTPDPAVDPEGAQLFAELNGGLVERMEIQEIALAVQENTLNRPLPPLVLLGADALDQDPATGEWWTLGRLGGDPVLDGCQAGATIPQLLGPGETAELPLVFARGGESFLLQQLADERCDERQQANGGTVNPLACKELALRARTTLVFDTAKWPALPKGSLTLRLIIAATFFVDPL
ncbi:MAG: hypothetical protein IT384_01565 [Deltaproteobacteria bacterium]|nr:hypothetical protein [Deltaproteobacteria bacterium]